MLYEVRFFESILTTSIICERARPNVTLSGSDVLLGMTGRTLLSYPLRRSLTSRCSFVSSRRIPEIKNTRNRKIKYQIFNKSWYAPSNMDLFSICGSWFWRKLKLAINKYTFFKEYLLNKWWGKTWILIGHHSQGLSFLRIWKMKWLD